MSTVIATPDQQMREEAVKRGWNPDDLSLGQYRKLALAIRPATKIASDVWRAGNSVVATTLKLRVVPLEQWQGNKAICEACPSKMFVMLKGVAPACNACQCAGRRFLEAKWKDPKEFCPKKHWDNRKPRS